MKKNSFAVRAHTLADRISVIAVLALFAGELLIEIAPARANDWPQWGGPRRDIVSREKGIVKTLSTKGLLPRVWATPIGGGYAGPAVANGKVYVTDRMKEDGTERVLCLDAANGKILWKHAYPVRYTVAYDAGPRMTPVIDDGKLYTIGAGTHVLLRRQYRRHRVEEVLPRRLRDADPGLGHGGLAPGRRRAAHHACGRCK